MKVVHSRDRNWVDVRGRASGPAALVFGLLLASAPVTPAVACLWATPEGMKRFYEAEAQAKAAAPVVVEGYVRSTGAKPPSAWAELVVREHYKGPRKRSYLIYYMPNSCQPSLPMKSASRQKIFIAPAGKGYVILGTDPLDPPVIRGR
jgi:hypothetical protein